MKRYVFSLHRVLRVRATQETVARQALRSAAELAVHADDDYDQKARNYEATVASAAARRGTVLSMLAMRDIAALRAKAVVDAEEASIEAHSDLDRASQAWAQAKQKLGALENLDERQRIEHRALREAQEQAESDDLVTGRTRRAGEPISRIGHGEVPR